MNSIVKDNFRFHSLDALRFFAFFLVFLKHINEIIPNNGNLYFVNKITDGGAVEFFFVLSGFLFTYLILKEKNQNKEFSYVKFYAKRILRTWPLFLLVLGVSYLVFYGVINYLGDKEGFEFLAKIGVIQGSGYWPSWKHSFLFLENYKMWEHQLISSEYKGWFPLLGPLHVTWSLCVQEHFYLIWPILIMKISDKNLPKVFGLLILLSIISKLGIYLIFNGKTGKELALSNDFFTFADLYALGGFLGYLAYFQYDKISKLIMKIPTLVKILIVILTLLILKLDDLFIRYLFTNLIWNSFIGLFLVLTIAFFLPGNSFFKFSDKNIFSRLGKMSYSLYLLHLIVIHLVLRFFSWQEIKISSVFNLSLFVLLCVFGTFICALFSYQLIEKPFSDLKRKIV